MIFFCQIYSNEIKRIKYYAYELRGTYIKIKTECIL